MIRSRKAALRLEEATLAPYAQYSAASAGRRHPEPPHPYRTEYQRDSARIIHSRAFRRLEYKTQVFLSGTGDHLRTRLTHTMEVVSISRSIARAMGLNEDLAEAIALGHDLGHAPFGHAGERALNEKMAGHGGFDHNAQSLRILEHLEKKYPAFEGLNLTYELLEGLQKHRTRFEPPLPADAGAEPASYTNPSLEAQVADIADEIAYYSHDLDDGLDAGLITPRQLEAVELWSSTRREIEGRHPGLQGEELWAYIIRCLIDREVEDVIQTSHKALEERGITSVAQVRHEGVALIGYSPALAQANRELRKFLYQNLYFHPTVAELNERACNMLRDLFDACLADPTLLGEGASRRIATDGHHRAICDYLAGMTDRYLQEAHRRLFGR